MGIAYLSTSSEERQALRLLLSTVLGSTTGTPALDFIQATIGRRVMVVNMTQAEIALVRKALQERVGGIEREIGLGQE